MAFSQAISGLNVAYSHRDVIGNNIANSATFGFKCATASFADVYAGSGVGLGVKLNAIQQNFSDGSITKTNRVTDLAISGGGFSGCKILMAIFFIPAMVSLIKMQNANWLILKE